MAHPPAGRRPGIRSLHPRTPVLVGVGTASAGAEPAELILRAVRAAADDCGVPGLLAAADRWAVPQGSWSYADPARLVSRALGAHRARTHLVGVGIPQQTPINDALAAIAAGRSEVAVVAGGEARRWARTSGAAETVQAEVVPDVHQLPSGALVDPVEIATGLWEPVQQYAMIDNALRYAEGRSLAEHRRELAALGARCNLVAQGNPAAAFPQPMDAAAIDTPSATNRPLAFPYNKWHVSQWTVDQAAALVLCSVDAARRYGVPADRWVFPLVGIESSHAVPLVRRARPEAWPAMGVLGRAVAARLGRPVAAVEHVELYSCFPAAVRVQQRELGLDPEGTPTVTGGMVFAGGPFNNYVLQATVALVGRLRSGAGDGGDERGMVTSVSGLLTKPGIGVWSASPDGRPVLVGDLGAPAARRTGVLEVVGTPDGYRGEATVVTYTVVPGGQAGTIGGTAPGGRHPGGPPVVVALCHTADGRRCVAFSEDPAVAAVARETELIGAAVVVEAGGFRPEGPGARRGPDPAKTGRGRPGFGVR